VITMEMLGRIRRMHLRDKMSLHAIAKQTGLSRNTLRRWLREPDEAAVPRYQRALGTGKLSAFHAALVLAAVPTAGLDAVLVAVELAIESGALSAEHVLNVLARLNATPRPQSVQTTLQLKEAPLANTSRYDRLRSAVDVAGNAVEVRHAQ